MKSSLKTLLATILSLALVAGVAVPLMVRARRQARMTSCAANLSELWKTHSINSIHGHRRSFPRDEGKQFWLQLSTTSPALVEPGHEIYGCPVRGGVLRGQTHYLGPRKDVNTLGDSDPVGCDEAFNHGADGREGGKLLRKSGDVLSLEGPLWLRFIGERGCIP